MKESFTPYPNLCSELVSIAHPYLEEGEAVIGNLEAIGERTALILTDVPLRRGLEIRIKTNKGNVLNGFVESSHLDELLGWSQEVRLTAASRWSSRWFKPEHFLALNVLAAMEIRKSA